jgi:hypothetical protein
MAFYTTNAGKSIDSKKRNLIWSLLFSDKAVNSTPQNRGKKTFKN